MSELEATLRSWLALKERVMRGEEEIGEFYMRTWNGIEALIAQVGETRPHIFSLSAPSGGEQPIYGHFRDGGICAHGDLAEAVTHTAEVGTDQP